MLEEFNEPQRVSHNIKNLFLDPNNYRFKDEVGYKPVPPEQLLDPIIQKRTRNFIEGNKRRNITDLIESFKSNGFLPVDVIQVRNLGDNNYLVIEGNRRVATLKALQEDYENGLDIGQLSPEIFKKVPFEIHNNEDDKKHLIIMGLKHISGNKKWSAYNQSQLIYDYLLDYWQTDAYWEKEEELCNSLGVSKQRIRTSQRAHFLVLEYLKSDYGDQFVSDRYTTFTEIVTKPAIKEWLEWDDTRYIPRNEINKERLFSWISRIEDLEEDSLQGEKEPIITAYSQIRDLAKFIHNESALQYMEETGSLARALVASGEVEKVNYEKSVSDLKSAAKSLASYKELLTIDDINEINESISKALPAKRDLLIHQTNVAYVFEHGQIKHFDEITISNYRVLNGLKIGKLNRINIFAGFNNTGKTSLLEAIHLLTKLNDISAYLELLKLKNKTEKLSAILLNNIFKDEVSISGSFNALDVAVNLRKYEDAAIDKKDDYIASYELASSVEQDLLSSIIHTFALNPMMRNTEKVRNLCYSAIKSPYFYSFNEVLKTHERSVRIKDEDGKTAIQLIVNFLKNIDSKVKYIELTQVEEGIKRFIVDAEELGDNLDITHYGEGLQRIFEIALAFAYCRNGVLCVDEFETAIHYSLLVRFSQFVQELAVKFNVQVFITTHSKECISAFIENDYHNDDIAFFTLVRDKQNKVQSIYYDAKNLQSSLENDLEIRGW